MAIVVWEVVERHWCDLAQQQAQLLEERVYPGDTLPDPGRPHQVRERKCSLAADCNLTGHSCRWAWTNPDCDPFAIT